MTFEEYIVKWEENPCILKIYDMNGDLVSTTTQMSNGMLLTTSVESANHQKIQRIIDRFKPDKSSASKAYLN